MKCRSFDRESFTAMLIEGKTTVPGTEKELLIDAPFFYSTAEDVQREMKALFTPEWIGRKCSRVRRNAAYWAARCPEDFPDEAAEAHDSFRREIRREMRWIRGHANIEICRCWVKVLKHRPEYADRCPWRFFQGDRIWQTLQDGELLHSIKYTPLQLAEKFDLNAMTQPDWDEAIKTVPELAPRRSKHDCYVI
ncbi:MAG: hypothetical protein IJH79_07090 [Lentisphaeria bacterium]|nr:hypothetical protein [Lentisphaeria bacterium]